MRQHLPSKLSQPLDGLELIAQACDWHVCPDREAGWDHPVLWLLKDADGLDRVRLYDLEPSYLRHEQTPQWIEHATRLYEKTADLQSSARIWQIAADMDLPVAELIAYADARVKHS